MATMTVMFPLARDFFSSSVLLYFTATFIFIMLGAGLVVIAGTLHFLGKMGLAAIIFGVLLGLVTLALH